MAKEYKVKILHSAEQDLEEIIVYIAVDNKDTALAVFDRLYTRIMTLERYPERGRIIPELFDQNILEYRELIERPWRIFYTIHGDTVFVYEIIDGRRNVQDILVKKLMKK